MIDDATIRKALRSALPPVTGGAPSNDVWPAVACRSSSASTRPWLDLGIAVAVALALWRVPGWLWLLAYHL